MPLTLAQLEASITVDQARSMLLGSLQGLGIVVKGGTSPGGVGAGTGSISLSGTPTAAFPKIVINITTAGEQGTAQFQYSLDGGTTFTAVQTVPANPGAYVLGSTGVTVTFNSGPAGTGTSFTLSDQYIFALQVPGLPVTSWGASGAFRQWIEVTAQALAAFSSQQSALAAGGFTPQATGSWADLLASNFYGLSRNQAAVTKGVATLTDAAGAGPFTVAVGQIWIADSAGHIYNNLTGGTLPKSGTLQLSWAAQQSGAVYNVANGTLTNIVAGTLAGVTVNNPDPGTGSWITSQGSDAESDSALLLRCQQRWPALSQSAGTAAVYDLWAKSSEAFAGHTSTITKTLVQVDGSTPGQIDIYLAGASGAVGGAAVTDAQSYINPRTPLTATTLIQAASNLVLTVTGTVNYFASKTTLSAIQAAVAAALAAYINALGIGSDAGGANVKAYYSELLGAVAEAGAVNGIPVVRNVAAFLVNGGSSDIGLTTGQVATLTNSLTFTAV